MRRYVAFTGFGLALMALTLLSTDTASAAAQCSILPQSVCDGGVMGLIKFALQILTAGVGIVAVGTVIFAGILYTSAGDNANQVSQAKTLITNVVIGVISYGLWALILNILIPGGVFG